MQDGSPYYDVGGFVYTAHHALEIDAIWRGVDVLEYRAVPLEQIARALDQDWETSVIALAMLGRRP